MRLRTRQGDLLTFAAYEAIGGVQGAVAERARREFNALDTRQQAVARRLFLSLVTPGEGREDTRARIALPDDPELEAVIKRFTDRKARLLVTGEDRVLGHRTVEVSHEALIRGWGSTARVDRGESGNLAHPFSGAHADESVARRR